MINVMCILIFVNWDTLVPWVYQLCCLPSINNTIQYNTLLHAVYPTVAIAIEGTACYTIYAPISITPTTPPWQC